MKQYKKNISEVEQIFNELIDEQFILDALKYSGFYPEKLIEIEFHSTKKLNKSQISIVEEQSISETPFPINLNTSQWKDTIKTFENVTSEANIEESLLAA
ncbi:hypothetical protein ACN2AU_10505 [Aerococcus viridans]